MNMTYQKSCCLTICSPLRFHCFVVVFQRSLSSTNIPARGRSYCKPTDDRPPDVIENVHVRTRDDHPMKRCQRSKTLLARQTGPAFAAEASRYALVVSVAHPGKCRNGGDNHRDAHQHAERQNDDMLVSVCLEYIDSSEYQPDDTGDGAARVNATQMLKLYELFLGRMTYESVSRT